jgi:murein DD-endopeptidase MepM/ murein hydrolase activator NlpD
MRHRRAIFERLAPWATLGVLLGAWWAGAWLVQWSGLEDRVRAQAEAAPDRSAASVRPREALRTPAPRAVPDSGPTSTSGVTPAREPGAVAAPEVTYDDITDLRARRLTIPVTGVIVDTLVSSYHDPRNGSRPHEAIDIMAPRGTPVIAVEDGRIARLFTSERGGLTIYQFDGSERFTYYYAHLDAYAAGIREGDPVDRGQTLGFVGTSGNAAENAPHLHFAIFKLGREARWWQGTPIDPFLVWR